MLSKPVDENMDINKIMEVLPHRFPMLLVDRILSVSADKCQGIKNVTINEAYFQGHYPGMPIMPGVLILESMAQTGAVILLANEAYAGMIPVIGAIENVKYKRPVVPGDQLLIDVELLWLRNSIGKISATAKVEGDLAAQMEMTFKLLPGK
ncbi:MAG TPA: 3-hydroxyacyl-ACP dehydratase FabZ [Fimbriimonadaceae bacterium]|nr:3-hydroxyacyl-ACP dehydratase FabZ [Fimbriimonadaceae bacterium]